MDFFSPYAIVIEASVIIILSYFFTLISKRTNIPSVLMLIFLGILINIAIGVFGFRKIDLFPLLEVLGIVGLIMIVLEASMDLRITREKRSMILKAFLMALVSLALTVNAIALVLYAYLDSSYFTALLYATPLSVMSSAIIIPSVASLEERPREFMIYESTLSDILGIMLFYFLIESAKATSFGSLSLSILGNIGITAGVSLVIGYLLIIAFQKIQTQVKFFLLIAVLVLLYSVGKLFHLSSLLVILVFGLMIENRQLFFRGFMKKYLDEQSLNNIYLNFKLVTIESAFVVRTFFFVVFGMTLVLGSLLSLRVLGVSLLILLAIYGLRYVLLMAFLNDFRKKLLFMAPRGLITILLFYAIP